MPKFGEGIRKVNPLEQYRVGSMAQALFWEETADRFRRRRNARMAAALTEISQGMVEVYGAFQTLEEVTSGAVRFVKALR